MGRVLTSGLDPKRTWPKFVHCGRTCLRFIAASQRIWSLNVRLLQPLALALSCAAVVLPHPALAQQAPARGLEAAKQWVARVNHAAAVSGNAYAKGGREITAIMGSLRTMADLDLIAPKVRPHLDPLRAALAESNRLLDRAGPPPKMPDIGMPAQTILQDARDQNAKLAKVIEGIEFLAGDRSKAPALAEAMAFAPVLEIDTRAMVARNRQLVTETDRSFHQQSEIEYAVYAGASTLQRAAAVARVSRGAPVDYSAARAKLLEQAQRLTMAAAAGRQNLSRESRDIGRAQMSFSAPVAADANQMAELLRLRGETFALADEFAAHLRAAAELIPASGQTALSREQLTAGLNPFLQRLANIEQRHRAIVGP